MDIKVGSRIEVDHPITVLNPTKTFIIKEMSYNTDRERCYVRGEDTMWFSASMIKDVYYNQ